MQILSHILICFSFRAFLKMLRHIWCLIFYNKIKHFIGNTCRAILKEKIEYDVFNEKTCLQF